ncbi:DUF2586 family protein [Flagellimonas onchidii]|uniref:DUF2586 family protein n=1 Tax=Flagellimonas onchidii TaxID=2562684 RepID=UPI0010A678E8|nr:DUF2586 family protein [Allomuricauda onchidii]
MADLTGVKIVKGKIGANTIATGDGISGMVITSPAPGNLALGTVKEVYNLVDVESLGITPEFDANNDVNVYRHLREFFRLAGEGQKLYILLVAQATTMVDICEDTNEQYAKRLLIEADGEIRQIAIAVNPTGATTHLNGMPDDVYNSIVKAQGLALWAFNRHFPCQVLLEAYDYAGPANATADLRDLPNLKATKVSLVNGQDWAYADGLTGNARKLADVGTALGTLSKARVNQNIGENESFDLTDAIRSAWLIPGLSSHQKNVEVHADLQTLENKGYIFGMTYPGLDGVRWNNDHTCTEIILDAEGNVNEHTIAYGRTLDKAVRLLRAALLPKVKTTHPVNPKTGKLPIGVIKNFEGIGDTALGGMVSRKEISDGRTIIDADSDLIIEKILRVKFRIVPYGSITEIEGTVNLKTNL